MADHGHVDGVAMWTLWFVLAIISRLIRGLIPFIPDPKTSPGRCVSDTLDSSFVIAWGGVW